MRTFVIPVVTSLCLLAGFGVAASTALDGLVEESVLRSLAGEISGVAAKRNLDTITLYHRTRAGSQFREAAEHVLSRLQAYGYEDARILEFPADGKTLYGTQRARTGWDVEFAELWELDTNSDRVRRLADWASMPLSLAQDSLAGKVTTTLVDVGAGTADADYQDKTIRGRLILTSSQPEAVTALAIAKYGAAGIVSYAPNQKTAWWQEDARLVRWGHLPSFPAEQEKTFAFMISLAEARILRARLATGETVRLAAEVRAEQKPSTYDTVTATIPGRDPAVGDKEIVFTCHLDHPRPGANDNASGCVAILEVARALRRLIDDGALPPPRRTLRFLWPAEIEGSLVYLTARPDLAARARANIHLDMVGGAPETKAVFRVSGGPMSLPSFISDLGHAVGAFVNEQTEAYASGRDSAFSLVSSEGGKEPLLALSEGLSLGSDHQIFNEGSWRIPGIYLHDWPDRYIHTNYDTAAMIDPTKLKRAAFIAAVTGWYLATMDEEDVPGMLALLRGNALHRARALMDRASTLPAGQPVNLKQVFLEVELGKLDSLARFVSSGNIALATARHYARQLADLTLAAPPAVAGDGDRATVYHRNPAIMGPMDAFGYSYIEDKLDPAWRERLALDSAQAYEALNLVDGKRNLRAIHDWLVAEFGPVDPVALGDYLAALESIGVISATPAAGQ
jgi:hypothetical protein